MDVRRLVPDRRGRRRRRARGRGAARIRSSARSSTGSGTSCPSRGPARARRRHRPGRPRWAGPRAQRSSTPRRSAARPCGATARPGRPDGGDGGGMSSGRDPAGGRGTGPRRPGDGRAAPAAGTGARALARRGGPAADPARRRGRRMPRSSSSTRRRPAAATGRRCDPGRAVAGRRQRRCWMLAGLPGEAARARRLRTACLDHDPQAAREHRGPAPPAATGSARCAGCCRGLTARVDGQSQPSCTTAWSTSCDRARSRSRRVADGRPLPAAGAGRAAGLVRGQELAAVRLWMAALSADLTHDLRPRRSSAWPAPCRWSYALPVLAGPGRGRRDRGRVLRCARGARSRGLSSRSGFTTPVREAARLLHQRPRRTVSADRLLWRSASSAVRAAGGADRRVRAARRSCAGRPPAGRGVDQRPRRGGLGGDVAARLGGQLAHRPGGRLPVPGARPGLRAPADVRADRAGHRRGQPRPGRDRRRAERCVVRRVGAGGLRGVLLGGPGLLGPPADGPRRRAPTSTAGSWRSWPGSTGCWCWPVGTCSWSPGARRRCRCSWAGERVRCCPAWLWVLVKTLVLSVLLVVVGPPAAHPAPGQAAGGRLGGRASAGGRPGPRRLDHRRRHPLSPSRPKGVPVTAP